MAATIHSTRAHPALDEALEALRGSDVGFCTLTLPEGRVLQVNAAFLTLVGRQGLAGERLSDLLADGGASLPVGSPPAAMALRRPDGTRVRVLLQAGRLPSDPARGYLFAMRIADEEGTDGDLTRVVFDTVAEAIFVTDADCIIETVNPAFTAITGFSREEVVGYSPSQLSAAHHPPEFFEKVREVLAVDGRWQGEIWNRRKDGGVFAEWLSIAAIRNPQGQVVRYVGAFSDITERKEAEAVILRQANYDALTELPNRTLFQDRLGQTLRRAERGRYMAALLFVDLDLFKEVNDTLGHAAGDQVLREAARRLQANVRKEDTVARIGGDEFTLILPEGMDGEGAARVARKLVDALNLPFVVENSQVALSASIGIALYPLDGQQPEALLRAADHAMYQAKRAGRNGYAFANQALRQDLDRADTLSRDLRPALEAGDLHMLYQPIVALSDERVAAFEATPRWDHPRLGPASPEDIRDAARASESGVLLDRWQLVQLGVDLDTWAAAGIDSRVMLRLHDLRRPCDLKADLLGWADEHPGQAGRVTLVVTETDISRGAGPLVDCLAEAGAAGFSVAIDHYGVGYTPFSHMLKLPLGWLRIDRSLVNEAMMDEGGASMIKSIIRMAGAWNLKVVASGIESHEQQWLMRMAGCDFGQGTRFPGPMGPAEVAQSLAERDNEAVTPAVPLPASPGQPS